MTARLTDLISLAHAFPLSSHCSFESASTVLSNELREAAAGKVSRHARGCSDDVVDLVLHAAWKAKEKGLTLRDHVRRWANELLEPGGNGLRVKYDLTGVKCSVSSHAEAVLRWRSASLHLPKALLIGAAQDRRSQGQVLLATPTLECLLQEEPWAEIHLHAGAATDFDSWWVEKLITARKFKDDVDRSKLQCAGLLRWLLRMWLWHGERPSTIAAQLRAVEPRNTQPLRVMSEWLSCVRAGRIPDPNSAPLDLSALAGPFSYSPLGLGAAAWTPAAGDQSPPAHFGEVELVRRYYERVLDDGDREEGLELLFWQYQRIRTQFFNKVIEGPGIAGLQRFRKHYGVIKASGERLFERALAAEVGLRLHALEVRPSFPDADKVQSSLRVWAMSAARVSRASKAPELGLVLSLIKPDTELAAKPGVNAIRFAQPIQKLVSATDRFIGLMDQIPSLLLLIRGVDIASQELRGPTWLMAPFLRKLRDASLKASAVLSRERPVPPLRITAHAGEEGHSSVEGLRRIDELIRTGTLREGDRIGHGLALGQAPSSRTFLQTKEARLFDLLWELDMVERREVLYPEGRIAALGAEVERLVSNTGLDLPPITSLKCLPRELLHADADLLKSWLETPPPHGWTRDYLVRADLCEALAEPMHVTYGPEELEAIESLRRAVVRNVAMLEIVVEVNPSSNLVIADLESLREHPVFRLAPLGSTPSNGSVPRIGVAICDDDPITFATNLADEVAYTHAAIRTHLDVTAEDALAWIDNARRVAMRARFTIPVATEQFEELARALGEETTFFATPRSHPTTEESVTTLRR